MTLGKEESMECFPPEQKPLLMGRPVFRRAVPRLAPLLPLDDRQISDDSAPDVSKSHIDWSLLDRTLFGREKEIIALREAVDRCTSASKSDVELVLVTGASGTGKTALINSVLRQEARRRGAFFISGKFDQLSRSEQYYPVIQAFTDFVEQVLEGDESTLLAVEIAIKPIVETDSSLVDMLPALSELVDCPASPPEVAKGPNAECLLLETFCRFVRALSSPSRPLILFIDDLQWADEATLKLVHALVSDSDIQSFMVLGACRGNEVTLEDDLSVTLRALEEAEHAMITNICLSDLTDDAVGAMLTDVLKQPRSRCERLASWIVARTNGNVLFVRQLLIALGEEGLFVQDSVTGEFPWETKEAPVLDAKLSESAIRLVSERIQRTLSRRNQNMLAFASCLGAQFDESVLSALAGGASVKRHLAKVERSGLISFVGGQRWRFLHDQIQMACYGAIPENERAIFHVNIGRALIQELADDELETHAFLILDQLCQGLELIESPDEREHIALLCLKAGEKATRASSFQTAAVHLRRGVGLLRSRNWRDQYYLSLELYNATAEIEYCLGNFERMDELLAEVLDNARVFSDRVRAYTTRVFSLGTRSKMDLAVKLGIEILRGLGEQFPTRPRLYHILLELMKTNRILGRLSDEDILNLPTFSDPTKFAVMRLMSIIVTYAYTESSLYTPILAMRLVQITVLNGNSVLSGTAFSCWAVLLCNIFGRVEDGVRYARLSLQLLDISESRYYQARTRAFSNGFCLIWTDSLCEQLLPLRRAHADGLSSGDIETAFLAAFVYGRIAIHVSVKLTTLAVELKSFVEAAETYNQDLHLQLLRPLLQMVQNLCGQAKEPTVITGEAMDEKDAYQYALETKNHAIIATLSVFKLMLCFHFGAIDEAIRLSKLIDKKCQTETFSSLALGDTFMFQGLAALSKHRTWGRRLARRKLRKLKWIANLNPTTFRCKELILEGEIASSKGHMHQAVDLFEQAAASACRDKVQGEKGLALERAAATLLRSGREERAVEYFDRAVQVYTEWGAFAKVDYLRDMLREKGLNVDDRRFNSGTYSY